MTWTWGGVTRVVAILSIPLFGVAAAAAATAQQEPPPAGGDDRAIAEGRVVYEANCVGCHQADGRGVPGSFPPLLDNPNVEDAAYVADVVRNGLEGEIEVLGETYDSAMPAFALLTDEQVDSLVVFLQEGLSAPVPEAAPTAPSDGGAGGGIPDGAKLAVLLAALIVIGTAAFVVWPVAAAPAGSAGFSTPQAWLKSLLIVAYFTIATVLLPSRLLESDFLASPPSVYLDLFSDDLWEVIRSLSGTTVWFVALAFGFWGLRRLQRQRII